MKTRICGLLLAAVLLGWIANTQAAVMIVDWGGDYVSATRAFANPLSTSPQGGFSGGDPLQLNPTTGYSGGSFYGMVSWTTTGADGSYGSVANSAAADRIEIKRYNTDLNALVLWRQTDFLNGLNSGNIAFDSASTVSMNLNSFVGFDAGRVVIRLEGGANDGYYISQQTPFTGTGLKSASLTGLTWLAYDPASDPADFGLVTDLLLGGLIENVTEIGFYTHSNATSPNAFRLDSFEVTAIAVPEPATSALVLGGIALLVLCKGRNRGK